MSLQEVQFFHHLPCPLPFKNMSLIQAQDCLVYQIQCSFVTSAGKEFLFPPQGLVIVICQLISEQIPRSQFFSKDPELSKVLSLSQCMLVFALKKV